MNLGHLTVRVYFLNSGNLICRSTDILMYFRESLGVHDNESRLYLKLSSWVVVQQCKSNKFLFTATPQKRCMHAVTIKPDNLLPKNNRFHLSYPLFTFLPALHAKQELSAM